MLTEEERQEISAHLSHYPQKRGACIEALMVVQQRHGWVSDESLRDVVFFPMMRSMLPGTET